MFIGGACAVAFIKGSGNAPAAVSIRLYVGPAVVSVGILGVGAAVVHVGVPGVYSAAVSIEVIGVGVIWFCAGAMYGVNFGLVVLSTFVFCCCCI